MRRYVFHGLFLILAFSAGYLLISQGISPLLYTVSNEQKETPFHTDIRVIRENSVNSSEDLIPVMQDLLDFSGTIAITIRKNDLETAGEDLARYQKRYQDLNNLILKLDMNESEVAEFSQDARKQNEILRQFVNSSESLQALQKLEVQYHEDDDPSSLTTVRLQGEALERKLRSLREEYDVVSDRIAGQAAGRGLDARAVREGTTAIRNFTRKVAADQDIRSRQYADADLSGQAISLLVTPSVGEYRDSLEIFGFITGESTMFRTVWILVNGSPEFPLTTDDTGEYRSTYEIGIIPGGNHTISAYCDGAWSESRTVSVSMSNTTLSLGARAVKDQPVVNLSGLLSARQPVKQAPVRVLVNNETWNTTFTDDLGRYFTSFSLPSGSFTVCTAFDNASFPLNGSVSTAYDISSDGRVITSVVRSDQQRSDYRWLGLLLLPGVGAVAWWYVRRTRKQQISGGDGKREPVREPGDSGVPVDGDRLDPEDLSVSSVSSPGTGRDGPRSVSDTAHLLYCRFVSRISAASPDTRLRSLTPRELERMLADNPQEDLIRVFIRLYERIRYGGHDTGDELEGLKRVMHDIRTTSEEDHREE